MLLWATLVVAAALQGAAAGTPPPSVSDPFYADPLFDAAHDAEFVWHEREQAWWVIYLQNRYNSPLSDPAGSCAYCVYTDFGLASTPDGGVTWVYRGVAEGVDVPVALRNHSVPSTRPPDAASQMYGGATWWRPAVVRHNSTYHMYAVYNPTPGDGMAGMRIIHYTSVDLKHWAFAEVARSDPVAYDSDVFLIGDGRWILFSTEQTRPRPGGAPKPRQSRTLYNWTDCDDAALQIDVGEGPHVTGLSLNDATTPWKGYAWLNWEGGFVMRSADKGLTWQKQPSTLFTGSCGACPTSTDFGAAHQGPLVVTGGRMFVLYFTEFATTPATEPERNEVNTRRSMLQLREVTVGADGWLSCNRSAGPPEPSTPGGPLLAPPVDAHPEKRQGPPTPAAVADTEATVIALAELNRWHGGWYVKEGGPPTPPPNASRVFGVYHDFRLGNGFYREQHSPSADACVATCKAEPASADCGGMVFKENATAGGLGVECGVGHTCCYLMTRTAVGAVPKSNCALPCVGWDSWAEVGIVNGTEPPKPGDGYVANFGKWRNPTVAAMFFESVTSKGEGPSLVWSLAMRDGVTSQTTGQPLKFSWEVAANGTILAMTNATAGGATVAPLRQWRRGRPFR